MQRALELVDVAEIQNGYSIIDRQDDELVEFAREREIAFVPFFPLGSAFTGGPARLAADPAIVQVADKHGATPAQVALAWLLARYDRMLLIPGTTSVATSRRTWLRSSSSSTTPISPPSIASDSATAAQSEVRVNALFGGPPGCVAGESPSSGEDGSPGSARS